MKDRYLLNIQYIPPIFRIILEPTDNHHLFSKELVCHLQENATDSLSQLPPPVWLHVKLKLRTVSFSLGGVDRVSVVLEALIS